MGGLNWLTLITRSLGLFVLDAVEEGISSLTPSLYDLKEECFGEFLRTGMAKGGGILKVLDMLGEVTSVSELDTIRGVIKKTDAQS